MDAVGVTVTWINWFVDTATVLPYLITTTVISGMTARAVQDLVNFQVQMSQVSIYWLINFENSAEMHSWLH